MAFWNDAELLELHRDVRGAAGSDWTVEHGIESVSFAHGADTDAMAAFARERTTTTT